MTSRILYSGYVKFELIDVKKKGEGRLFAQWEICYHPSMNPRYPLILLAMLSAMFGPYAWVSAHETEAVRIHAMHMMEKGYEPKDLRIRQGDTVIFENDSTEDRWPASNIHPTHEIYPELDPGKPVTPGSSWEFRFDQAGEWRYHDHLFPTVVGKIVVEEDLPKNEPRQNGLWSRVRQFFARLFSKFFQKHIAVKDLVPVAQDAMALFTDDDVLRSYVYTFRPAETTKRLHELSAEFGDCHQSAHKAGRFAYEFFKEKAFQECSAECHSGCYHGATEAYFRDHGTANLAKNLGVLCGPVSNPFFNHQCIHGIGHGLMAWTNYDIRDALAGCDLLHERRDSCYTGVFMENIVGGLAKDEATNDPTLDRHITNYLSDDPQFPCSVVDETYKHACYFYQTSRMVKLFDGDFKKVAEACGKAPKAYHSICLQSMGRDVGGVNRGNPAGAIATCANAPAGALRRDCIAGAVQDSFWDPSGQDNAIAFCTLLTDAEEKKGCYDTIFGRAPLVLAGNDLKQFCEKVEKPYQTSCESSAGI